MKRFILLVLLLGHTMLYAQRPKGSLFIIGGGEISDTMRQEILQEAHWKKGDHLMIITLASTEGKESYDWHNEAFKKLTGENSTWFDSADLHDPVKIAAIQQSRIIFLGGGDQDRFMKLIAGTTIKTLIQQAYRNGAVIAGTSAGASVMSNRMITGNSLTDTAYSATFPVLKKNNLEVKVGLALLDSVIIDQHFVKRSRYNRMLSAVMENPGYQCIGIDESTAIVVKNGIARVTGESQVLLFTNAKQVHTGNENRLAASSISISILLRGEKFAIKK